MSKITQEAWDKMSDAERADYILNGDFKVVKQSGIPADSIVGDCQVVTSYKAMVNGVELTGWQASLADCISVANDNLVYWSGLKAKSEEPITQE